jgi:ABC-type glutathione transport system ATPase component
MTPLWSLRGVRHAWRGRPVLLGVDLDVRPGERVALVGRSGTGKTTLLRCGAGLLRPDAGTVLWRGADMASLDGPAMGRVRRELAVLPQDPAAAVHPGLPVGLLVQEVARVHRPDEDPRAVAVTALATVGLGGRHDAWPHELSGGELRRVGLARLYATRPALLLADEPTAGLDPALRLPLLQDLFRRVGPDCAVVCCSHDLATTARVCSRVVVLDEGRIVDDVASTALGEAPGALAPITRALVAADLGALDG